jgi:putative membrane protein
MTDSGEPTSGSDGPTGELALSLTRYLWDDRAMVRRLLGLLVPFAGSAVAVYLSTVIFDREMFDHAISLSADTTRETVQTVLIVTVIFGLVNLVVKPVVRFVTFPIRILSFGLFSLIINGGMLLLTGFIANRIDLAFRVELTWWVIVAALFIGLASGALNWIGDKITRPRPKTVVKVVEAPPPSPQVPQYQPRPQYGPPPASAPPYGSSQPGSGQAYGSGQPYGSGPSQGAAPQHGAGAQYGAGPQYGSGQPTGSGQPYGSSGQQSQPYGPGQQYGPGQSYGSGQYGTGQQYGPGYGG